MNNYPIRESRLPEIFNDAGKMFGFMILDTKSHFSLNILRQTYPRFSGRLISWEFYKLLKVWHVQFL